MSSRTTAKQLLYPAASRGGSSGCANVLFFDRAGAGAVIFYIAAGRAGAGSSALAPVTWREIVNIVPYIVILIGALIGFNVMALLFGGMSLKYSCDPRRIASILDAASCVIQGIIPYGAQILIAVGIAKEARVKLASLELITLLIYPMFLGLALLASILFSRKQN